MDSHPRTTRRDRDGRSPRSRRSRPVIGWREWVALPGLEVDAIKAKVDTGARTSALHAIHIRTHERRGQRLVSFQVHPDQDDARRTVEAVAEVVDERRVRNSGGVAELRPVILMDVALLDQSWTIEVTLTAREQMGFRMLLGRQAVRRRFCIDPARSFVAGRRRRRRDRREQT